MAGRGRPAGRLAVPCRAVVLFGLVLIGLVLFGLLWRGWFGRFGWLGLVGLVGWLTGWLDDFVRLAWLAGHLA